MKEFWKRYFPVLPVLLVLWGAMFSHSCANTSQAPTGGKKDTIPPVIVKMNPRPYVLGVPVTGAKFVFTFDEYFKVSNPRNIFLSPPQKTLPKYRIKGKNLIISFEEPLEENTTYTLNFYGALQDNNENNPYPGYSYVFSTGDSIDSLYMTGLVQDCSTLDPVKEATVLLYESQDDSAVFNQRPFAATKTDDWGYFCFRNIPDKPFRIYASVYSGMCSSKIIRAFSVIIILFRAFLLLFRRYLPVSRPRGPSDPRIFHIAGVFRRTVCPCLLPCAKEVCLPRA